MSLLAPLPKRSLKSLLKRSPQKIKIFEEKLQLFLEDPYHPKLELHKLKGTVKGYLAFTIEYNLRVVFYFANELEIVFIDIGTHDEVY